MDFVIRRAYKYRIYPTKAQISNPENQFSMCRHLYNRSLAERTDAYEKDGTAISYHQQQNSLPELKKKRPWYNPDLKEAPSESVIQEGSIHVEIVS
ncbi:hypothetical protein DENIS_0468 [Desulfonema ishimotonii]|uniref:Transposase putative helix-turn-helix domain-containing protein n=1 Tax=Desulfonema ishimotonii TaxID=45657 RepID=A0A401FRD6_9BACT|nr:helix-turn-helix domain-containing protein [Desulfonema ishimotonii]GBC59529.1 hypothetical protein DENIS_0468 [Desulfonema ishimotonii]